MDNIIIFSIITVVIISLIVGIVWMFVPMSKKNAMDIECRKTLLKMENDNGLTITEEINLQNKLTSLGFKEITITGTPTFTKKKGEELNLKVEVKYDYRSFKSMFTTEKTTSTMVYDRTITSRQVVK
ncbi:MAG TPA: hypothetical protein PK733_08385 [Clostridiales bacterium]|nr:hypothetical protein [Clostridiales bacterium]